MASQKTKTDIVSTRRKSQKEGVVVYRENPFWEPYEIKIGPRFVRIAGGTHISDEGEAIKHSGIHIIEEKDEDEFIKLYTRNMKAFFDLKPTTQKVLTAVLDAVQRSPNADSIYLHWFNVEAYSSQSNLKISRTSFHNALKEMIKKGFLAEAEEPNRYWINPHLFFNGNRMVFIREYRRKGQQNFEPKATSQEKPQKATHPQAELSLEAKQ